MGLAKLKFLYKTLVLENAQLPHNYQEKLPTNGQTCTLHNPTCGDTINVSLRISNDRINDLCFNGNGCSISQASASIMTDTLAGQSIGDALKTIHAFFDLCMGKPVGQDVQKMLGDAAVLGTVAEFPTRIKCATLAWHAVEDIIMNQKDSNK